MIKAVLPLAALLATAQTAPPAPAPPAPAPPVQAPTVPVYAATVVARFPHDRSAFTEGLLWCGGSLYESTGEVGQSDIRRVSLADGKVIARVKLPAEIFGEGIACRGASLLSVTWTTGIGYRWNRATLKRTGHFTYAGEGWAMTGLGDDVVLSDGTPTLRVMDPARFTEKRRIAVTINGRPLKMINELESVRGEIFANIWHTGFIARIDPANGHVKGLIDLRPLVDEIGAIGQESVANGIAYDAAHDRLFVTGKNWPTMFEIRIGATTGDAH